MRKLPLYTEPPQAFIASVQPSPIDKTCELCDLGQGAKHRCLSPDGAPGGLLVLGESPFRVDDDANRPFAGGTGKYARKLISKWWTGPIVYDNAVRCYSAAEVKTKHLKACRTYGAKVLHDAAPARIIALGGDAIESLLDRRPAVQSVRRGYGWYINELDDMVPIFFVLPPDYALSNRFIQQQFESDLEWALTTPAPKPIFDGAALIIESDMDALMAKRSLASSKWITYDVETSGLMHNTDFKLESVTLLGDDADVCWVWGREALALPGARETLRAIFEGVTPFATQNGKFDDRAVMLDLGANVSAIYADTRLMRKMLEPDTRASLELLTELVGMGGHKEEADEVVDAVCKELKYQANPPSPTTPSGKPRKIKPPAFHVDPRTLRQVAAGIEPEAFAYRFLESDLLYRYNGRDVWSTRALTRTLEPAFRTNPDIARMWDSVVAGANVAVRWIEYWGFAVDIDAIKAFEQYRTLHEIDHYQKLMKYGTFNPASVPQLRDLLFNKLGLTPVRIDEETDNASTDSDTLDALEGKHPIISDLRGYRKFKKLAVYAGGMLPWVRDDGRIHSSWLLDGAGTGRSSSQKPNLQNIPSADRDPVLGKMARDCFIAPRGHKLLEFDYSQLELRVAAMLSQDPNMIADFVAGIDIHTNNARECAQAIWKITPAQWDAMTKDQQKPYRARIKTTTFGKLYGKSDKGLAHEFNCKVAEVQAINAKIWGRYNVLDEWTQQMLSLARKTGEAWTWWNGNRGRRRPLPRIASHEQGVRENAERSSWNTPIQGTAAEYMTASFHPIVTWLLEDKVPAKVVCTVHDSIIFEVRDDALEEVAWQAKRILTSHPSMGVPLKVDAKVGQAWGSLKEYHVP